MDDGLLSGVLAVQLGLATPAQVIAAASAHVADPSRSIPGRLHTDGVLSDKQLELLESVTENALRVHGGDARKTMESLGGERAVLRSFGGSLALDRKGKVAVLPPDDAGGSSAGDSGAVSPEHEGRYTYARGDPDAAEIGRGGIGRVMIAHDGHIGRDVAIKELLGGNGSVASAPSDAVSRTTAVAARFLREARVTGQLEHPNIVPVYEVGQRADGTYYYAMRLVRGRTLGEALGSCKTLQERLKLLPHYVSLCNAVGFAHSRGVIHRDIKPDNVMLGAFGETVVLDWGLAKVRGKKDIRGREIEGELKLLQDAATGQTMDGSAIGTPAYMSPEQADGQIEEVDERSDVWSLGAVLYELLLGRPPFEGVTPFEIIGKVMKDAVTPPRELDDKIPAELSAVASKALTREPSQRYATAKELAAEIEAFMSGGRIGAYDYSTWELLQSFARRNRAATVAALVVVLIVLGSSAGLFVAYRNAERERDRAEDNERQARLREIEAQMNLSATFAEKALRLLESRRYGSARVFAAASLVHNPASPRGNNYDATFATQHPLCGEVLTEAASIVYEADHSLVAPPRATFRTSAHRLAFLPDSTVVVGLGDGGELVFVDVTSGQTLASFSAQQGQYVAVDPSFDGSLVAAATKQGAIQLFDARTRKALASLQGPQRAATNVRFSRDARRLAVTFQDATVDIWDVSSRELVKTLRSGHKSARDAAFGPDGRALAVVGGDGHIRLWDTKTAKLVHEQEGHAAVISAIELSPGGSKLATVGYDGNVRIWESTDLRPVASRAVQKPQLSFVRFTRDGKLLLTGGDERAVVVYDTNTWDRWATLDGFTGAAKAAAVSTDGKTLAVAGGSSLWVREFTPPAGSLTLRSTPFELYRLAVSRDGGRIAAGHSRSPTVDIWDTHSAALIASLPASGAVFEVAFSSDGKRLFGLSSESRTTDVWDLLTQGRVTIQGSSAGRSVRVSPDGKYVGVTGGDEVQVWDAATNEVVRRLRGSNVVAFAPDSKVVATALDNSLFLYALPSGERVGEIDGLPDRASDLTFSSNGRWIALAGLNAHLLVIDVQGRKLAFELPGHRLWINTVRFAPDDSLLASASDDGTVRLWSMDLRSTVQVFHTFSPVGGIAFLPDKKSFAYNDISTLRIVPLDLSYREADPNQLFERAQDEMRIDLRGTELVPRP